MGIFNWVQNKVGGKQDQKKRLDAGSGSARYSSTTDTHKEEFSDWPEGWLLAIGTLGNKELKEEPDNQRQPSDHETLSFQDLPDFTVEETSKLRKELTKLLAYKPKSSTDVSDRSHLPLNRFLNCPPSLKVDRKTRLEDETNNGDLLIILTKARDFLTDKRNAMKQRSLKFLLKKMFVCIGGFEPSPSFWDPVLEYRMEKILRSLLHKKLHARNQTPASSKKFLENKHIDKKLGEDKMEKEGEDAYQWVKTDSEYIVLEI